ncbi:hypothetical protein ACFL3F_05345 [Planctomycetota bacterium]
MAMKGPLRHELSKYGKGRPGSIRGLPYAGSTGRKHYATVPVSFSPSFPQWDLYHRPLPQDYHPNIHAPAAQSDRYEMHQDWELHHVSHTKQPSLFQPYPDIPQEEDSFDYEKSKSVSEFFLRVQEVQYRHFDEGEEIPSMADIWMEHFSTTDPDMDVPDSETMVESVKEQTPDELARQFMNISGALGHLQTVFPEDHPDIINLRTALHEILDDPEAVSKLESLADEAGPSKLGPGNPYVMDSIEEAGQLFEQQMEMDYPQPLMQAMNPEYSSSGDVMPLDNNSLDNNALSIERMAYEEDLGPAGPLDALGPESLEQVIEDQYEQAMDGHSIYSAGIPSTDSTPWAPESFLPEIAEALPPGMSQSYAELDLEEDPLQMLDPVAAAQQIFDEQMQFMENPFMPDMLAPPGIVPGL